MKYKLETKPFPDGKTYRNTLPYLVTHAVRFKLADFKDRMGRVSTGGYSAVHWQTSKTIDKFITKKMEERYHKNLGGKHRYCYYHVVEVEVKEIIP